MKIVETSFQSANGPNGNPLMPAPESPAFKNNAKSKLQPLELNPGYRIDFETEKGKSYTVVPL